MNFETFINLLLAGITLGTIYLLMAMGLNVVFGVTKIFNYAQGSFFCWGGYIAWYLAAGPLNLNYAIVIAITLVAMFLYGVLFEKVVISPLRRVPGWDFTALIVTMGCALLLDNLILVVFGPLSKGLPFLMEGAFNFGDFAVSKHNIIIFLVATGTLGILALFFGKTRTGMALRAVAQDEVGAKVVGLPVATLYSYSFGISATLAAVAAILLAPRTLLYPLVGWTTFLKALVVIVLGGLGNLKGSVIAAFMLAITEIFVTYLIGGIWAMPLFLGLLMAILVIRPKGLFGV